MSGSACLREFSVIDFSFRFPSQGDIRMMSSYPLSRCPACKKAFRLEIKNSITRSPALGLIACPHCGLKIQRFDPQYLNASARPLSRSGFSNFG